MDYTLVIARDAWGCPIKRFVVGRAQNCVYLANPARIRAVESGESSPIGVPTEDVFTYEEQAFRVLERQWVRDGRIDQGVWKGLIPYSA